MPRTTAVSAESQLRKFGITPTAPFPGVNKPWPAVHDRCGNAISPRLANVRKREGGGCRSCAADDRGVARKAGHADAAIEKMRAHGWEPLEPYPGSKAPWLARHERCGTERASALDSVVTHRGSCVVCWRSDKGHRVWDPESAVAFMKSVGLTPLVEWPGGSSKPWPSRHDLCGREVSPRLGNLAAGQGPCNHCGYEDGHQAMMLDLRSASAVMRAAGLEPLGEYPGVDRPWLCIHVPCGREVSPTLTNIKRGQGGCGFCGTEVGAAKLRLPEEEAVAIMVARGLTPIDPYLNSSSPWRARHSCGRIVSPTLSNVRVGNGICRYCNSDFPFDGPAQVYLVADRNAIKIGCSSRNDNRIAAHVRYGWTEAWRVHTATGDAAYELEQAILTWWRTDLGLRAFYTRSEMPQWGYSETAPWGALLPSEVLAELLSLAQQRELQVTVLPAPFIDIRPSTRASRDGARVRRRRPSQEHPTLF
jgi:hypothetical protein